MNELHPESLAGTELVTRASSEVTISVIVPGYRFHVGPDAPYYILGWRDTN